jgi:hypothetical protein
MKRCPAARGVVIASNCSAAMSRTSPTEKPTCGNPSIEPSKSFLTASSEAEKSDPRTGPSTKLGLTVTSSSPAFSFVPRPCCALRNRLRPTVGGCIVAVRLVSPIRLCERLLVRNKAIYIALGVAADGTKEVLGLWIENTEGARFWFKVMTRRARAARGKRSVPAWWRHGGAQDRSKLVVY